jgi:hypothetical protein
MSINVFVIGLMASILGAVTNFCGIEENITRHKYSAFQYTNLSDDISFALKNSKNLFEIKTVVYDNYRLIDKYAAPISTRFIRYIESLKL